MSVGDKETPSHQRLVWDAGKRSVEPPLFYPCTENPVLKEAHRFPRLLTRPPATLLVQGNAPEGIDPSLSAKIGS